MARLSDQPGDGKIGSGSADPASESLLDRRRPGRKANVSPKLIGLLRDSERLPARLEADRTLGLGLASVLIGVSSAAVWLSIARGVFWFIR